MSEPKFTISLAQLNPTVGDVPGNAAKARAARDKAAADGADLVVLPELFITGYPPEDLVLKPAFQAACRVAIEELARETAGGGPAMLIGTPWVEDGKLYNACALLDDGRIAALRFKANLPNYGVFDEKRLFARGPAAGPVTVRGIRVGVPICEDIWLEESEEYENVVECLAETGAEILVVPNGSPYARDKNDLRLSIAVARVTESGLPLVYLNQIGGQDELVFDGASFALNADLSVAAQLPAFEENITTLIWTKSADGWRCNGKIGVERKRSAVEHQFVLPADLVQIHHRQPALGHARHRDRQPQIVLVARVGRAVRNHQNFRACLGEALDDVFVFL